MEEKIIRSLGIDLYTRIWPVYPYMEEKGSVPVSMTSICGG